MDPLILALTTDLFLVPKLEDVAQTLGFRLETIENGLREAPGEVPEGRPPLTEPLEGDDGALVRRVVGDPPALILIDLTAGSLPWERWLQVLKTSSATRRIPVVAFGPHVEEGALKRAKEIGADRVVTRGQFHAQLVRIVETTARQPDWQAIADGCSLPLSDRAREGLRALSAGRFFEAHERFEQAVLAEPEAPGTIYRCLLHLAVAHLHTERANWRGAQKMLLRIRPWLATLPPECRGIDVDHIRREVNLLQDCLDRWDDRGSPPAPPPPPHIRVNKRKDAG